jgi:hypothetical protein
VPAVLRKRIGIVSAGLLLASLGLPGIARAAAGWHWPVRGSVITRYRNGTDPYAAGQHRGIDIAAPVGAPVLAASAGTVRFEGRVGNSGLVVDVRTADGRYDTSYLHLSAIAVREGQRVEAGRRLGAVGTTGRRSAVRPHLHFGVRDAGRRFAYHDPLDFLPPAAGPAPRAPRGAPAPVALPLRPLARPAPVSAEPSGRPLGAPSGRPVPLPIPGPAPRVLPAPPPAPVATSSRPGRVGIGPAPIPRPATLAGRLHGHAPAALPAAGTGTDFGWLALCLGLLLAGAFLGTTPAGREQASRSRARLRAVFRPLMGFGR